MDWKTFNDNHSKIGIEGKYAFKNDTFVVFVEATNSAEDWISNFTAFPVPLAFPELHLGFCHAGYSNYAWWLAGFIQTKAAEKYCDGITLIGYSMGGGVAQIAALILEYNMDVSVRVASIDGPKTTTKLPGNGVTYYNKGSIVHAIPPWFRGLPKQCLNEDCRALWVAHADYNIGEIIEREIG